MAGGFVYNVIETPELSTSEIYGKTLAQLAGEHKEIVAVTADLATSTKLTDFTNAYPERVFNVGIAEQNMIGVAGRYGESGPCAVCFHLLRIRFASRGRSAAHRHLLSECQRENHRDPFRYLVRSGGLHPPRDCGLAVTRAMPNLTVICPADGYETANAVRAAYENFGPYYIRINRGFDRVLYDNEDYGFEVGKAVEVHPGTDITVIACGSCVFQAREAAKFLESADGLKVRVLNMHTIKPIDKEAILKAVQETRRIITVEDHSVLGGLGSAVAEVVVESGKGCAFKKLGHPDKFAPIGLHEDIMSIVGIDANGIIEAVREVMHKDFEEDDNWGRRCLSAPRLRARRCPVENAENPASRSVKNLHTKEELYSNKIFFNAALPLVKVIANDVPSLKKQFAKVHAINPGHGGRPGRRRRKGRHALCRQRRRVACAPE